MPTLSLSAPPEFSFTECLRYLGRSAHESLHIVAGNRVKKIVCCQASPVMLTVSQPSLGAIQVDYQADHYDKSLAARLRAYVTDWFDLATDLRPFYDLAQRDALLAIAVERHYGLRMIGIPDLFEALCWAIIGQQINLTFAYTLKQRMVHAFGDVYSIEGLPYYQFPRPETIAHCLPEQLTALQFSARKAAYVIGIARSIIEGRLSKEALRHLPEEDARTTLMQYKGVGAWTANYVLLKCLKKPDAFPAQDVGLHNALKQLVGLPQKPALDAVYQYAEAWRGWRGYATFYLWQTLLPKVDTDAPH